MQSLCIPCSNERARAWREAHPYYSAQRASTGYFREGSVRWKRLWDRYGITEEEFHSLEVRQNDSCAICHKAARLVVDHDHSTGRVRGLLCTKCNTALHYVEDEEWIRIARSYLGMKESRD